MRALVEVQLQNTEPAGSAVFSVQNTVPDRVPVYNVHCEQYLTEVHAG